MALTINSEKTKYIMVTRVGDDHINLHMGNITFEQVQKFKTSVLH